MISTPDTAPAPVRQGTGAEPTGPGGDVEGRREVGAAGDPSELPSGLRMAIARLSRQLRQTRAGADLSPTQYQVLATIVRVGPVRLSDLAADEGLNPTMLSRIAGKLEAASLVVRIQDPTDGRAVRLAASTSGMDLVARVRRERTDALSQALDDLADVDRAALLAALPVLESLAEVLKGRRP